MIVSGFGMAIMLIMTIFTREFISHFHSAGDAQIQRLHTSYSFTTDSLHRHKSIDVQRWLLENQWMSDIRIKNVMPWWSWLNYPSDRWQDEHPRQPQASLFQQIISIMLWYNWQFVVFYLYHHFPMKTGLFSFQEWFSPIIENAGIVPFAD
jgi:hypothetical protein